MKSETALILPNRIYPLGASSSPEDVFVTRIGVGEGYKGRDIIYFHGMSYGAQEQRMEAEIFLSLCETAMKKHRARHEKWSPAMEMPAWMQERKLHYANWLAGKNTMPELKAEDYAPATYEPMRVTVSAVQTAFVKGQGRASDPWYAAEEYGSVVGVGDSPDYVIYLRRRDIPKLQKDARFTILRIRPEFEEQGGVETSAGDDAIKP